MLVTELIFTLFAIADAATSTATRITSRWHRTVSHFTYIEHKFGTFINAHHTKHYLYMLHDITNGPSMSRYPGHLEEVASYLTTNNGYFPAIKNTLLFTHKSQSQKM